MVASAFSTIALALLLASGVSKIIDPDPTRGALKAAGLPSSRVWALLLGAAEVSATILGLVLGGWWLAAGALLYLGFMAFTLAAVRRRIPVQSCGCFGKEDTPPSIIHVAYNGVAALALGYLAITAGEAVPWSGDTVEVLLFLGFAAIGGFASYLLLAQLPRTLALAGQR